MGHHYPPIGIVLFVFVSLGLMLSVTVLFAFSLVTTNYKGVAIEWGKKKQKGKPSEIKEVQL